MYRTGALQPAPIEPRASRAPNYAESVFAGAVGWVWNGTAFAAA